MSCGVSSTKLSQRSGSPKFVVTLDGASESLTAMDTIDADTLLTRSSMSARNVVRVKPQTQSMARLEPGNIAFISTCVPILRYLFYTLGHKNATNFYYNFSKRGLIVI